MIKNEYAVFEKLSEANKNEYAVFGELFEKIFNDMEKNSISLETAKEIWVIGLEAFQMFGNNKRRKFLVCDEDGYHWKDM